MRRKNKHQGRRLSAVRSQKKKRHGLRQRITITVRINLRYYQEYAFIWIEDIHSSDNATGPLGITQATSSSSSAIVTEKKNRLFDC